MARARKSSRGSGISVLAPPIAFRNLPPPEHCPCCLQKGRFWTALSLHGAWQCGFCHPPSLKEPAAAIYAEGSSPLHPSSNKPHPPDCSNPGCPEYVAPDGSRPNRWVAGETEPPKRKEHWKGMA